VPVLLERVGKTYGSVRALTDVSASFEGGTTNVVEGPNGSGKSTLLAIVATLVKPTFGRVDHGELGPSAAEVRSRLGWVGHDSLCYPDLSGRENIELAARLCGEDPKSSYERAAERFKLGGFVDRAFRTYSRGQRQRVSLARSLVHAPALLLLDEPSTGLDQDGIELLRRVVGEEAAAGSIVLVITHDRSFADGLKSKRFRMDRGRMAAAEPA
jgi:heme exporter protein A